MPDPEKFRRQGEGHEHREGRGGRERPATRCPWAAKCERRHRNRGGECDREIAYTRCREPRRARDQRDRGDDRPRTLGAQHAASRPPVS